MEYTSLGTAGVKVSRLCMGAGNFGSYADEAESFRIMDACLDAGINFFDTADVYGSRPGESEEMMGRWFAQGAGRRENIVLATKLRTPMSQAPNAGGISKLHMRQACEDSLRRLQTDHIDLYQVHSYDPETSAEEFWEGMETLMRQGKVLYGGSSNFAAFQIARFSEEARARRLLGLVTEQCRYNLVSRMIELELAPAARQYGLSLLPWSPRAGGLLSGRVTEAKEGHRKLESLQQAARSKREQLDSYETMCKEIGEAPGDVAVAWLLGRPGVAAPIIGPRTAEQVTSSLRSLEIKLDNEVLQRLDGIFPPPSPKEAPEAYIFQ